MLNGHIIAEPHEQPTRLRVLEIVPATVEHVYELAETLRDADRREILNLGINVKKALWRAFRNSIMCRTALLDAKVAAIWGLGVGLRAGVSPCPTSARRGCHVGCCRSPADRDGEACQA